MFSIQLDKPWPIFLFKQKKKELTKLSRLYLIVCHTDKVKLSITLHVLHVRFIFFNKKV